MTPHKCPVCFGTGKIAAPTQSTMEPQHTCPACHGACVLWEPVTACVPYFQIVPDPEGDRTPLPTVTTITLGPNT